MKNILRNIFRFFSLKCPDCAGTMDTMFDPIGDHLIYTCTECKKQFI